MIDGSPGEAEIGSFCCEQVKSEFMFMFVSKHQ